MKNQRVRVGVLMALVFVLASCVGNGVKVTWKDRLQGDLPQDVKSVQLLEFNSQVKDEAGIFSGVAVADQSYGRTVATMLGERVQQAGIRILPGNLKDVLDKRDVIDALVNEGVMKPEAKEKLQKIAGLDAIIVGDVSCTTRKDHKTIPLGNYGSLPMDTVTATATVNFRMYSIKTGSQIKSKTVSKTTPPLKSIGSKSTQEAIIPLLTQCVDDIAQALLGGEVVRYGKMFGGGKGEEELQQIIEPLDAGIDPERIADKLEAYAKAHPNSASAKFDLAVLAFRKGDKPAAAKLVEEAIMTPGADRKAYQAAWEEMQAGGKK